MIQCFNRKNCISAQTRLFTRDLTILLRHLTGGYSQTSWCHYQGIDIDDEVLEVLINKSVELTQISEYQK